MVETGPGRLNPVVKDVDIRPFFVDEVDLLASAFNASFPYEDAHVVIEGDSLRIFLFRLNMDRLRAVLYQLVIGEELKNAVFDCIDSIKNYGLSQGKRVFAGFREECKATNRAMKAMNRGKHYYANDNSFSTDENLFPAKFENQIVCGDSLEVLKTLPNNCVDIIFTSPPYNFGLEYNEGDDAKDWSAYFATLFPIFSECIRVLKFGGRIGVNVQPAFSDYVPTHHIISDFFLRNKMIWKGEILWEKNNFNCKACSFGSWRSPSSPYLKYTWEFIEVFCKGDLKKKGEVDSDMSGDEFKQWVVAKWNVAPEQRMSEFGHPAMFPVALAERFLKLFSFPGDIALDPFCGMGTTAFAAKKTARRFFGIDVSEEYCEGARKRLEGLDMPLFD